MTISRLLADDIALAAQVSVERIPIASLVYHQNFRVRLYADHCRTNCRTIDWHTMLKLLEQSDGCIYRLSEHYAAVERISYDRPIYSFNSGHADKLEYDRIMNRQPKVVPPKPCLGCGATIFKLNRCQYCRREFGI